MYTNLNVLMCFFFLIIGSIIRVFFLVHGYKCAQIRSRTHRNAISKWKTQSCSTRSPLIKGIEPEYSFSCIREELSTTSFAPRDETTARDVT